MSCISHPSVLKHPSDTQRDVESPPPTISEKLFYAKNPAGSLPTHTRTHSSIHVCQAPTTCLALPEYE